MPGTVCIAGLAFSRQAGALIYIRTVNNGSVVNLAQAVADATAASLLHGTARARLEALDLGIVHLLE